MQRDNLNPEMEKAIESKEWHKAMLASTVINALERNNMTGFYVKTRGEALEKALSLIPEGSSVGLLLDKNQGMFHTIV